MEPQDSEHALGVIVVHPGALLPARISAPLPAELLAGIQRNQDNASAVNTNRAYESDWAAFDRWCDDHDQVALPASGSTVAAYLTDRGDVLKNQGAYAYAPSTLSRWLTSINAVHQENGQPLPGGLSIVKKTLSGIRRTHVRPTRRMAPLLLNDLKKVLAAIDTTSYPDGIIGHRDSAILIMGFAGAFRRSELTARLIEDFTTDSEQGLVVRLLTAKTDQEGRGSTKSLPFGANPVTCPPCAFLRWVRVLEVTPRLEPGMIDGVAQLVFRLPKGEQVPDTASGRERANRASRPAMMKLLRDSDTSEHICQRPAPELQNLDPKAPLFRPVRRGGNVGFNAISGEVVNDLVKRRLAAVGMNPLRFGGHSLRAGFVTQALRAGASHLEIMRQTDQKNPATVEIYRREHDNLRDNAVTRLGL